MGLLNVMGLGESMADKIIAKRPYTSFIDFKEKIKGKEKMADILLKIGAFSELKFDSIQKQQSLFGDQLMSRQEFDYKKPELETLREFLPLAVQDKIRKKWIPWIQQNLDENPIAINEMEHLTDRQYFSVIGTTDPNGKFNPKNRVEELKSKGLSMEIEPGEPDPTKPGADLSFYDFLNFEIEDETDYVSCRIPYKHYKKYKEFMWSVKPNEVLLVRGMSANGIRMIFVSDVISLTRLKDKMLKGEELTKQESSYLIGEISW
jgi:DNA polymerase III alpha subunit